MKRLMQRIKGLYAVTPDFANTAALVGQVETVLAGGAQLLQYRNKSAAPALRREQAATLLAECRRHGAMLIINDDVELARELGADGVHVGADDAAVSVARARLGSGKIIGASCYNDLGRAHAAAAQSADYIAFGSFFASSVKPGAVRAQIPLLSAARELDLPVVAIGGITLENAGGLIAAGADAVAIISAVFAAPDAGRAARRFCQLFEVKKT
jgi:thiamine-phosphate pyrophosphorylase